MMTTASEKNRALRGTKRLCDACAVRFYDLARDPIVCPACGAQHTPMAQPLPSVGARAASLAGKTAWRGKAFKRPDTALPEPQLLDADAVASEPAVTEEVAEEVEEAADVVLEDDTVLEQEPDEGDVSGLIGLEVEEPKEG
jgi:uncharacterized protein (TIGR02300 family)